MHLYIEKVKSELAAQTGVMDCFVFGHLADGNMHFVVGKESDDISLKEKINDIVYNPLQEIGGSISAEHGIGLHKKQYLSLCRKAAELEVMRMLKNVFDPKGLLNVGKVL